MATTTEVEEFDQAVRATQTVMIAALVEQWTAAVSVDPAASVDVVRQLVLDLVAEYGLAAAAEAVDFYNSVRPAGSPAFSPVPSVRGDLVPGASLNWSTQPLLTETFEDSLDRIAAEIQKATFAAVVETIGEATQEDPLDAKYARFPQNDNPCAWCILRASKGAVFWSEETATRGDHTKCQCKVTVVFPGEPLPYLRAPYMAQFLDGAAEAEGPGRKALLSGMRRANDTR